jgi:hypothetical protein
MLPSGFESRPISVPAGPADCNHWHDARVALPTGSPVRRVDSSSAPRQGLLLSNRVGRGGIPAAPATRKRPRPRPDRMSTRPRPAACANLVRQAPPRRAQPVGPVHYRPELARPGPGQPVIG